MADLSKNDSIAKERETAAKFGPTPVASAKTGLANPEYVPLEYSAKGYSSFSAFYPYYLGEHSQVATRRLHLTGTSIGLLVWVRVASAALPVLFPNEKRFGRLKLRDWKEVGAWLAGGLVQGYFWAWIGHFFIEKNRPATFQHPVYSLMGDFKLWWECASGKRKI